MVDSNSGNRWYWTTKGIAISINYVGNVNISGKVISNTGAQDSAIIGFDLI